MAKHTKIKKCCGKLAIFQRFVPKKIAPNSKSMQKQKKCIACLGSMLVNEGFFVCSECGIEGGRCFQTSVQEFGKWHEFSSSYTRTSRFRKLLREINGESSMPDELIRYVWENKNKFSDARKGRDSLIASKVFAKYQNKIGCILSVLKLPTPNITMAEIDKACILFSVIDRQIYLQNSQKTAFTFLIPVILLLIGRADIAKSHFIKQPSVLLWKKYGNVTFQVFQKLYPLDVQKLAKLRAYREGVDHL